MTGFPLPFCPAKKSKRFGRAEALTSPIYIIGKHAEWANDVLSGVGTLPLHYLIVWPQRALPATARASLEIALAEEIDSLPNSQELPVPESYFIQVNKEGEILRIRIYGSCLGGLKYGLLALLANFWKGGRKIELGWEVGWPDFPIRGIVEGFYGVPWSQEERLQMVAFLERYRFNAYLYAPKYDHYHRQKWAHVYPKKDGQQLAALGRAAEGAGLRFIYGLAPGLTIQYSSLSDRQRLINKIDSIIDLGVKHFALLLDDISEETLYEADRREFGSVASCHAFLANLLWDHLQKALEQPSLLLCPTEYCGDFVGRVQKTYLSDLGRLVDPRVKILWTGPQICSEKIDRKDAHFVRAQLGRPPLYWDNYPVNDVAMERELHIGPYEGRSADLVDHCHGFLANPMSLAEASKIALATLAEFVWDAATYRPEEAWRRVLKQAVGNRAARSLEFLGLVCQKSPLRPCPNHPLDDLSYRSTTELHDFVREAREAVYTLTALCGNRALVGNVRPWLQDLYFWSGVLSSGLAAPWEEAQALANQPEGTVETIGPQVRDVLKERIKEERR